MAVFHEPPAAAKWLRRQLAGRAGERVPWPEMVKEAEMLWSRSELLAARRLLEAEGVLRSELVVWMPE